MPQSNEFPLQILSAIVSKRMASPDVPDKLWPQVIESAVEHGLGPMLLRAVKQGGVDLSGESRWAPLLASVRETTVHRMLQENALLLVQTALAEAGIEALWLKGSALAYTVYPEPALRPMSDLDVLVRFEQREPALRVAESLGYHRPDVPTIFLEEDQGLALAIEHHFHLEGGPAKVIILEVHYQLLSGGEALLPPDQLDWFWKQTDTVALRKTALTILKPEAQLLHLITHALMGHGEGEFYLLRFFDMHLLAKSADLDWHLVVDQAVELGWTYAVERALAICRKLFDTPVPEFVFEQLRVRRPADDKVSRVVGLQGRGSSWESVSSRLGQLPLPERVVYACRILFPSPRYMRYRYGIDPNDTVWLYYLKRWHNQAREVAAWIWRRYAK